MKHTRVLDRADVLQATMRLPSHQLAAGMRRAVEELLNTPTAVPTPTEDRPVTEFGVGVDKEGRPVPFTRVELLSLVEQPKSGKFIAEVVADAPLPVMFKRHVWAYGQPQPEIIAQLGLEVLQ